MPPTHSWVHFYLMQETLGPTVGVPYDYVVPDSALVTWHVNGALTQSKVEGDEWRVTPQEVRARAAGRRQAGGRADPGCRRPVLGREPPLAPCFPAPG
jgi:hypothetical protein